VDEGGGSTIVMLHGNPTWSFYYRNLITALRDEHRVIAPDHVGCGLSDKPRRYPYTLSTHVENFSRLMDHLRLSNITLAVHDWGGAVGLGWAMHNLDRVRRLVLFNTAAFFGPVPFRIRVCRLPFLGRIAVLNFNAFARAALRMACVQRDRMTAAVRSGYLFPYGTPSERIAIWRFVRDIPLSPRAPSHPIVKEIEQNLPRFRELPSMIFWGGKDFCFNDGFLDRWKSFLPRAVVHRFPDAGHYVVEDAHERIIPLFRAFVSA
jgi:pimeloyl-ACP methyl ester carboxylesterase